MVDNKSMYETWKQTATYSKAHEMKEADNAEFQANSAKFYACTDHDMAVRQQDLIDNAPVDPKTLVK